MARPRKFEIEDAVSRAMGVFWDAGYDEAALPRLLAGMGIGRASLYRAFGDKKRLFLLALARYERARVDAAVARLCEGGSDDGWARIERVLMDVVEAVRSGDRRGCLVCTAAGTARGDEDIARAVAAVLERMTSGFAAALAATPEGGTLELDGRLARARALTATYVGLQVLARAGMPAPMLEDIVRALRPTS